MAGHGQFQQTEDLIRAKVSSLQLESSSYRWNVALDIGTAASGYCYSMKGSKEVIASGIGEYDASIKVPTCSLYDKKGEFLAFGTEAESLYKNLCIDNLDEAHTTYYFHTFKMLLHDQQTRLTNDATLKALNGLTLPAVQVFADALRYLADHFRFALLRSQYVGQGAKDTTEDVRWVVTVPAIWQNDAKQFMQEAAVKAGLVERLDSQRLVLALEPEAAALWCRMNPVCKTSDDEDLRPLTCGDKAIVVDAGGGTVDITAVEVLGSGGVKALNAPGGGPHGSQVLTHAVLAIFDDTFGKEAMVELRTTKPDAYLSLLAYMESAKRAWTYDGKIPVKPKFRVMVPHGLDLPKGRCSDGVSIQREYLILTGDRAQQMADKVIDPLIEVLDNFVKGIGVNTCPMLFLVGGYANFKYLVHRVETTRQQFPPVITPAHKEQSVLRGALSFGEKPGIIEKRVLGLTYGTAASQPFDASFHPTGRKTEIEGKPYCQNVFNPIMTRGTTVQLTDVMFDVFENLNTSKEDFRAEIWSHKMDPDSRGEALFCDDPRLKKEADICVQLGASDEARGSPRPCAVWMTCAETTIRAGAIDLSAGETRPVMINFLPHT